MVKRVFILYSYDLNSNCSSASCLLSQSNSSIKYYLFFDHQSKKRFSMCLFKLPCVGLRHAEMIRYKHKHLYVCVNITQNV